LAAEVERKTAAIKPGVSLEEFERSGIRRALNFWDPAPGGLRETVFFVSARTGNASVSDELVCRFDRSDRLVGCKLECCRGEGRLITIAQYHSVRIGDSRSTVEERLCSPSDVEVEQEKIKTSYHIAVPIGHHDEGQTVMLIFKGDRLSWKGMSPYY
jgi:hypothetical protein